MTRIDALTSTASELWWYYRFALACEAVLLVPLIVAWYLLAGRDRCPAGWSRNVRHATAFAVLVSPLVVLVGLAAIDASKNRDGITTWDWVHMWQLWPAFVVVAGGPAIVVTGLLYAALRRSRAVDRVLPAALLSILVSPLLVAGPLATFPGGAYLKAFELGILAHACGGRRGAVLWATHLDDPQFGWCGRCDDTSSGHAKYESTFCP